jgi:hypothetical protein
MTPLLDCRHTNPSIDTGLNSEPMTGLEQRIGHRNQHFPAPLAALTKEPGSAAGLFIET